MTGSRPATRVWLLLAGIGILMVGTLYLVSRGSGWRQLARHYAARERYRGAWISRPNADGRCPGNVEVTLNHGDTEALEVGADRQGLHLSVSAGFRLFHPPLFVPWSDVRSEWVQALPWKGKHLVRLTFARTPDIPLDVDRQLAGEIQKRSEGRWAMPRDN